MTSRTSVMIEQGARYCSFCGASEHDVETMVAGPVVFICDKCVAACVAALTRNAAAPDTKMMNRERCEGES